MASPRHVKHPTPSPRTTASVPVYALPYKRLDPFTLPPQQEPTDSVAARQCRRSTNIGATPKSLQTIDFDSNASRSNALFAMLPTPAAPSTPKFPIQPQYPHQRTSVAATAAFLDAVRSQSLLDFSYMRAFSLAHRTPVAERSLTTLSATSVYRMRIAHLSLEAQGRSFAGRQQWLRNPEPLETTSTAAVAIPTAAAADTAAKSDDAVRPAQQLQPPSSTARSKRTRTHRPAIAAVATTDSDAAVSCFPTLWGSNANVVDAPRPVRATTGAPSDSTTRPVPTHLKQPVERIRMSPATATISAPTERKGHTSAAVSHHHGFLAEQDIPALMASTGYDRPALYERWTRFKALCSLSTSPTGIDRDTFHRSVPMLEIEDDAFIDRLFAILDTDRSGILEWHEFVAALSALEPSSGDQTKRVALLFRVYDVNGDGAIDRSEAHTLVRASLLGTTTTRTDDDDGDSDSVDDDMARDIVTKLFAAVGCSDRDNMRIEHALAYLAAHPATDISSLFGRTMVASRESRVASRRAR